MWFGNKVKLSPRYIGIFEVLDDIGTIAYRLALPPSLLGFNIAYRGSMLKKYHGDGDYIIKWELIFINKILS